MLEEFIRGLARFIVVAGTVFSVIFALVSVLLMFFAKGIVSAMRLLLMTICVIAACFLPICFVCAYIMSRRGGKNEK